MGMLNETLILGGCPKPCTMVTYSPSVLVTKDSGLPDLKLFFAYQNTVVTERTQVLLYNLPQFLSAAGGTLGMYLGFSLYTVISESLDWTKVNLFK